MQNEEDVDLPSVYIDQSLLTYAPLPEGPAFIVNQQLFYEQNSEESPVEFQEFQVFQMESEGDMYCETPSGSESECGDYQNSELHVTLQPVPNGFVINGSCYLSWQQWNTLVTPAVSIRLLHCVVCAQYCEADASSDHVTTANHRVALQAFPPIDKFDLSVTRKIRDHYHCGVCNEIFELNAEFDHFGGKIHEGNLLFSINKASDILDNSLEHNNDKLDTYHFKTHSMNSATNDNESVSSDPCGDNFNYVNFQNNYYYDDFEEEAPVFTGLSYATMAKKPKVNTQTFIDVDLGNKKVTVRYDSWHMVISPKLNRFWCMVCKKFDHLRKKREHCGETGHLDNLRRCRVVEAYDEYFIRQVDDKLYHCGHCNNLQLIHEMEDHVESNHPRKRLVSESKNTRNSPVKTDGKAQSINDANDTNKTTSKDIVTAKDSPKKMQTVTNSSIFTKNNVQNASPVKNMTNNTNIDRNSLVNKVPLRPVVKTTYGTNTVNDKEPIINTLGANTGIDKKPIINPLGPNTGNNKKPIINTRNDNPITKPLGPNTGNDKNPIINTRNDNPITKPLGPNTGNDKKPIINTRNDNPIINPLGPNTGNDKNPIINTRNDNPITKPLGPNTGNDKNPTINSRNDNTITNPFHMNTINDKKPIMNTRNDSVNQNNGLSHRMPGLFDDIVIYPFGFKITVPSIAYNVISKGTGDFYCGLCDVICQEAVIAQHVYEVRHLELLQRTPFIEPFSYNLIRAIRDRLHCAICNIPIFVNEIYFHIKIPQHVDLLNKALNQAPKLPPIGVKIPNVPDALPGIKTPTSFGPSPNLSPNVVNNNINNAQSAFNNGKDVANNNNFNNNNNTQKPSQDKVIKLPEIDKNNHTKTVKEEYYKETELSEEESADEELERTFDSMASDDVTFDEEEHIYLKLKNTYIKISNTAYNTLVYVGDGSRYCFVCSVQVQYMELQKHVDGRSHLENMEMYRFLDKYEDHLLRQMYLMYHCAICNVIVTRKELKTHLEWPTHALQIVTYKNLKKTRKTEIKGGVKQIVVSTQKEIIHLNMNEPKIKICLNVAITDKKSAKAEIPQSVAAKEFSRKNKIIIFNDNVLKVSWDSWHAISKIKNGYKCNLCQRELKSADIDVHCSGEWHRYGLDKPFEKQYAPALIRKINESTLNCLFCNTEVSNKEHLVQIHVGGKKHVKNYEEILKVSSLANTYTDCHDNVLML